MRAARSKSRMPSAGAEIPVRLRFEIEHSRLAMPPYFDVVGGALADRHARVRQIGQHQQRHVALVLDRVELHRQLLDLGRPAAIGFLDVAGVLALTLGARHLVARGVLQTLQAFDFRDQPPPRGLERGDVFERLVDVEAAVFRVRSGRSRCDRGCKAGSIMPPQVTILYARFASSATPLLRFVSCQSSSAKLSSPPPVWGPDFFPSPKRSPRKCCRWSTSRSSSTASKRRSRPGWTTSSW